MVFSLETSQKVHVYHGIIQDWPKVVELMDVKTVRECVIVVLDTQCYAMVGSIPHAIVYGMHYKACTSILDGHMTMSHEHLVSIFDHLKSIFDHLVCLSEKGIPDVWTSYSTKYSPLEKRVS